MDFSSGDNMNIDRDFQKAVNENNILLVRIMLKNIIMVDPTLDLYNIWSRYAEEKLNVSLYEQHDGKAFADEAFWNKKYFNQEMVNLINNFSRERVAHIKDLCKKIYAEAIAEKNKTNEEKNNYYINNRKVVRKKGNKFKDFFNKILK